MENTPENPSPSTQDTGEALVADVNRLKEDVAKLTEDAKKHGRAHVDAAQHRFNNAIAAARTQLTEHPFAVLGAGLVLGYIFGRRGRCARSDDE